MTVRADPFDNHLPIGAVAERAGLAVSAIRFYESRGLVSSERTEGGQRRFRRDVLRRLAFIQAAQQVGLSLDDIGEALSALPDHAGPTPQQWSEMSSRWRPMLDDRIRLLERLRSDLEDCIGCGCLSLASCRLRNPGDEAHDLGSGPRFLMGDTPGH
jgi:MerR family redox-sensitive transcriptional activator SoxR